MADKIKQIAAFSEDAIDMALQTLSKDQWTHFEAGLDTVSASLGGRKERRKAEGKESNISDEIIFTTHILPEIQKRLVGSEKLETTGALSIIVNFRIKTDYRSSSIKDMLREHAIIVQTEEAVRAMFLIAQYSRGLLYLELGEKLKREGKSIKEFVEGGNLPVAYITVLRYMTLATIVLKYPRLLLCQLSFAQLMKHKTRLLHYLSKKEGHDLHCRLSVPFVVVANGEKIQIRQEEIRTPAEKFDTNPDWAFRDVHTKPKTTDEKVFDMLESRNAVDEEAILNGAM